jgi:hypothetical protein
MIWQVNDEGRIEVRLRAEGEQAIRVARVKADEFIANIVSDLNATMGIEIVTDELRYSFHKTRPEVTVKWRAQVPAEKVPDVREYMSRLAHSHSPDTVRGEVVDGPPDQ